MTTRMLDDLTVLKDDMKAFVEGHGMRRFQGYVNDEISSVMWDPGENLDSWKDFVELAKASNSPFVTMNDVVLEREDVDYLVNRMQNSNYVNDEDVEDAKWLRAFTGKTGFVQLGFPYQGTMFLCEVSTEWYDRYQRLLETADEFGGIPFDELEGSDGKDEPF